MFPELSDFQHRANMYGEKDWIVITTEDVDAAADFAAAYVDRNSGRVFYMAHMYVFESVLRFLCNYDETGYGNKPADMNRFAYWCAHISDDRLAEAMERCNDRPHDECVLGSTKPPSSAPKCQVCKAKIPRGELVVESRSIIGLAALLAYDRSQLPRWKTRVDTRRCTAPACLEGLVLRGPVALVDVPEGKRNQATTLAAALVKSPDADPPAKRLKTEDAPEA